MNDQTEVLYNASCPICGREVEHYAKLSTEADVPVEYHDLGDAEKLARWNVSAEEAAKRFHVRKGGQTYAGLPAFIVLWRDIPRTRWLARLFSLPGVHWIACKIYDHIAAPLLYAMHRRREARN
ncbi:MAG: DUF393 domain-containing protein [Sulfitobacter sp.]|nr:DUF393 domain-containing protein [Sulfitobacter sp.]